MVMLLPFDGESHVDWGVCLQNSLSIMIRCWTLRLFHCCHGRFRVGQCLLTKNHYHEYHRNLLNQRAGGHQRSSLLHSCLPTHKKGLHRDQSASSLYFEIGLIPCVEIQLIEDAMQATFHTSSTIVPEIR